VSLCPERRARLLAGGSFRPKEFGAADSAIARLVFELSGLTEEERGIVEGER